MPLSIKKKGEIMINYKKNKLVKMFIICGIYILSFIKVSESENLTITTYYPAPYGGYVSILTTGGTILARDSGNVTWANVNQLQRDQGGSIELGGTNATANPIRNGIPYIDFHYGVGFAQDFNVRIINDGNRRLNIQADTLVFSPATSPTNNIPSIDFTNGNICYRQRYGDATGRMCSQGGVPVAFIPTQTSNLNIFAQRYTGVWPYPWVVFSPESWRVGWILCCKVNLNCCTGWSCVSCNSISW